MRRTLHTTLQQRVQLTAADQPFQSLQEFLDAVRHHGPIADNDEHLARQNSKQQQQQQQQQQPQQPALKRPHLQGPGAPAYNAAAAAAAGPSSSAPAGPSGFGFNRQQQSQQPGQHQHQPSPHAGKPTFNPDISPAEAARRKHNNLCFQCGGKIGAGLEAHAKDCRWRLAKERSGGQHGKRKASG